MNLLPLFGLIFFTALCSYLIKLIADNLPSVRALFIQYLFCAFFISLFWVFFDRVMPPLETFLIIGGLALINYLGAYFQWSAWRLEMSRTSLFMPLSGLWAIALYFVFLKEYQSLKLFTLTGLTLYLIAISLFYAGNKDKEDGETIKRKKFWPWLVFILAISILGGLNVFFIKVLSFNISRTHFLLSWYLGSFIFSSLALIFTKKEIGRSKKNFFYLMPLLSLGIMLNLTFLYWALQLNSGTLVITFHSLNSAFIPLLIGWLFFGERKNLNKLELIGFILGAAAAILIILSL